MDRSNENHLPALGAGAIGAPEDLDCRPDQDEMRLEAHRSSCHEADDRSFHRARRSPEAPTGGQEYIREQQGENEMLPLTEVDPRQHENGEGKE